MTDPKSVKKNNVSGYLPEIDVTQLVIAVFFPLYIENVPRWRRNPGGEPESWFGLYHLHFSFVLCLKYKSLRFLIIRHNTVITYC
jgi:hypothetical protein